MKAQPTLSAERRTLATIVRAHARELDRLGALDGLDDRMTIYRTAQRALDRAWARVRFLATEAERDAMTAELSAACDALSRAQAATVTRIQGERDALCARLRDEQSAEQKAVQS